MPGRKYYMSEYEYIGICQWNVTNIRSNLLHVFHWFLMQIHNILQWTVVSTVFYRKSDNWSMETVYSKLKVGTSYNCSKWCSPTTYQKVNSSFVSKGPMNSFNKMFPLARIFPLAVMHYLVVTFQCSSSWGRKSEKRMV